VFGIVSGKGGVGKSMVTSQLAVTMRRRGFRSPFWTPTSPARPSPPFGLPADGHPARSEGCCPASRRPAYRSCPPTCCSRTRPSRCSGAAR
jgi:Mrp family chromosome partitioning ATPase